MFIFLSQPFALFACLCVARRQAAWPAPFNTVSRSAAGVFNWGGSKNRTGAVQKNKNQSSINNHQSSIETMDVPKTP